MTSRIRPRSASCCMEAMPHVLSSQIPTAFEANAPLPALPATTRMFASTAGSSDDRPKWPPDSTEPRNDPKATPASRSAVNGGAARSDGVRIILSVFGSALTVSVALAALILTTANDTRRQFDERIELTRRHSDLQFTQLRGDILELREDLLDLRGDVREVGGEVQGARRAGGVPGRIAVARPPAGPRAALRDTRRGSGHLPRRSPRVRLAPDPVQPCQSTRIRSHSGVRTPVTRSSSRFVRSSSVSTA